MDRGYVISSIPVIYIQRMDYGLEFASFKLMYPNLCTEHQTRKEYFCGIKNHLNGIAETHAVMCTLSRTVLGVLPTKTSADVSF